MRISSICKFRLENSLKNTMVSPESNSNTEIAKRRRLTVRFASCLNWEFCCIFHRLTHIEAATNLLRFGGNKSSSTFMGDINALSVKQVIISYSLFCKERTSLVGIDS